MPEHLIPFDHSSAMTLAKAMPKYTPVKLDVKVPYLPPNMPPELRDCMKGSIYSTYATTYNEQCKKYGSNQMVANVAAFRQRQAKMMCVMFVVMGVGMTAGLYFMFGSNDNAPSALSFLPIFPGILFGGMGLLMCSIQRCMYPDGPEDPQAMVDTFMRDIGKTFETWSAELENGTRFRFVPHEGILVMWPDGGALRAGAPGGRGRSKSPRPAPKGGRKRSRSRNSRNSRNRRRGGDDDDDFAGKAKFCTNCGTDLPNAAKFCSSCGTPQDD